MGQGSYPGRGPRPNADYLEREEVAFCIQGGAGQAKTQMAADGMRKYVSR